MRSKPSIFSKNYKKRIRRRRRRIISAVVIGILIVGVGVTFFIKRMENNSNKPQDEIVQNEPPKDNVGLDQETVAPNQKEEEKSITTKDFTLESGNKVTITYKDEAGVKKVQMVDGGLSVNTNTSPSQKLVFLCDTDTKDMYIVDDKEQLKKVTNPQYKESGSSNVYLKSIVMNNDKDYKWVEDGAFIDDSHIAYSSALPWFNKENNLYIWIYDIQNQTHRCYYNITGKEIQFKEITDKGLKISLDGKEIIIDAKGNIVK